MKCLLKYQWVKLPRTHLPQGKGLMGYWARLASRAAFRKGQVRYCGHVNDVMPGMWSGGVVGLKSILGVKNRTRALEIMDRLQELGYIEYSLDTATISWLPSRDMSSAAPAIRLAASLSKSHRARRTAST